MKFKKRYILLLVLLIVGFSSFLVYKEGSLPVDKADDTSKIFIIEPGSGVNRIADDLDKEDFIRSKLVFYFVVKLNGLENKIQAGDFRLSRSMSAPEIAMTLTKGTLDQWVTIIEGLRKEEIAQILSEKLGIDAEEFIQLGREGYLFPDTYLIPKGSSSENVLAILQSNFDKKYTPDMQSIAAQKGLTDEEVIILASLVEKEARSFENKVKVASIIVKRYKKGWSLDLDATIQYALGYNPIKKTWWKKAVNHDDLSTTSPYNTYKKVGLPPTAICNPGLDSINAVLQADPNTPYWFYISSRDGTTMHYGRTLEEHNSNIEKYLN